MAKDKSWLLIAESVALFWFVLIGRFCLLSTVFSFLERVRKSMGRPLQ